MLILLSALFQKVGVFCSINHDWFPQPVTSVFLYPVTCSQSQITFG